MAVSRSEVAANLARLSDAELASLKPQELTTEAQEAYAAELARRKTPEYRALQEEAEQRFEEEEVAQSIRVVRNRWYSFQWNIFLFTAVPVFLFGVGPVIVVSIRGTASSLESSLAFGGVVGAIFGGIAALKNLSVLLFPWWTRREGLSVAELQLVFERTDEKDRYFSGLLMTALAKRSTDESMAILLEIAKDPIIDASRRVQAIRLLGHARKRPAMLVADLATLAVNEEETVRKVARQALRRITGNEPGEDIAVARKVTQPGDALSSTSPVKRKTMKRKGRKGLLQTIDQWMTGRSDN